MAGLIVVSSAVLAVAFAFAWLVRPGFRERIEGPKHRFQRDLSRYDRECREAPRSARR
jgi:hypothetical protein